MKCNPQFFADVDQGKYNQTSPEHHYGLFVSLDEDPVYFLDHRQPIPELYKDDADWVREELENQGFEAVVPCFSWTAASPLPSQIFVIAKIKNEAA
jgi:hypothetical protein